MVSLRSATSVRFAPKRRHDLHQNAALEQGIRMLGNIDPTLLKLKPGARVLDVGSAEGRNSLRLKQAGMNVTAVEIDPGLVSAFRDDPDLADVDVSVANALEMPFDNDSFDAAVLIEVIEHIHLTDDLLAEIHRVLRAGAVLCIAVPTAYTERVYWRLHPRYASNATHVKVFSIAALADHLARAQYRIREIETKNFVPAVSWFFHSLARSEADHTGKIHNHHVIDRCINPVIGAWSEAPVLNRVLTYLGRTVGKSWYIYAEAF